MTVANHKPVGSKVEDGGRGRLGVLERSQDIYLCIERHKYITIEVKACDRRSNLAESS